MLDKLFGKKPATQSQTVGNVTGQVQLTQAGQDAIASQSGQMATQQQGLTGPEVLALLAQLQAAIAAADVAAGPKQEMLHDLTTAQREASKEQPNKELAGVSLKQVGETMKGLKETTEAGKSLWKTGAEVFGAIAPWLGAAFFGG